MATVESPDLINALVDYIVTYSTPALVDSDHVLNGFERNISPPKDGNDYCVIQPISRTRRGTTIQEWDHEGDEVVRLKEYVDYVVQVDCYSNNIYDGASRAQTLETLALSYAGIELFRKHGVDCQYADGVRNISAFIDEGQYTSRWCVLLHLGYWRTVTVQEDFVNAVDLDVQSVDVKFPPL